MSEDNNIQRLAKALGFDPDKLSAGKREQIEALSKEEVDKLIDLGGKISHKDDEYGPFPI